MYATFCTVLLRLYLCPLGKGGVGHEKVGQAGGAAVSFLDASALSGADKTSNSSAYAHALTASGSRCVIYVL
jgi:hypothetical protein